MWEPFWQKMLGLSVFTCKLMVALCLTLNYTLKYPSSSPPPPRQKKTLSLEPYLCFFQTWKHFVNPWYYFLLMVHNFPSCTHILLPPYRAKYNLKEQMVEVYPYMVTSSYLLTLLTIWIYFMWLLKQQTAIPQVNFNTLQCSVRHLYGHAINVLWRTLSISFPFLFQFTRLKVTLQCLSDTHEKTKNHPIQLFQQINLLYMDGQTGPLAKN